MTSTAKPKPRKRRRPQQPSIPEFTDEQPAHWLQTLKELDEERSHCPHKRVEKFQLYGVGWVTRCCECKYFV